MTGKPSNGMGKDPPAPPARRFLADDGEDAVGLEGVLAWPINDTPVPMGLGLIPPALMLPRKLPPILPPMLLPPCVAAPLVPPFGPPEKALRRRLRDPKSWTNSAAGASKDALKGG